MNEVQELIIRLIGIALLASGGLCIIRGGFGAHKANNGNDDINMAGWKSMGSWWALGGLQLSAGSYLALMKFFNGIYHYLIGS